MRHIALKINEQLKKADKIVIVAHQNPDGDALGSATALCQYLLDNNKQVSIFCASEVPRRLQFLPLIHLINNNYNIFKDPEIHTIIVLDSGDLEYAGTAKAMRNHPAAVINIDHHPTNDKYGHINLVIPNAASTSQILYNFFKHNNIRITSNMATSLLTGLITDTDNFSNSATSDSALVAGGELLRAGANLNLIHKWLLRDKSINVLKLWGVVFNRLNTIATQDIAYTYITRRDILQYGITDTDAEGISNFFNKMNGIRISLLLKETPEGKIKGSLRTIHNDIDVSAIAKKLGGGGHKKAAGFMTEGTIDSVVKKIVDLYKKK